MADAAITDPLGRSVVFHDKTWYGHIVKGHHEMAGHRTLAEKALSSPLEVHFSTSDSDCRVYYGKGPRPSVVLAVVADVVAGFVKTAYLTKKITGAREW